MSAHGVEPSLSNFVAVKGTDAALVVTPMVMLGLARSSSVGWNMTPWLGATPFRAKIQRFWP